MKRISAMKTLLPTVFYLIAMISCAQQTSSDVQTTLPADETAETVVKDTGYPAPDTSSLDFGGEKLRIAAPEWGNYRDYFPEKMTGESVDDAAFKRISNVQNALNVVIEHTYGTDDNTHKMVSQSIMANDDAFDIVFTHCIYGISDYATENLLFNLDDLPHLNFDAPWWSKSMIDQFRIGSETYYAFGDAILSDPACVLFNKTISSEYDLPNHYQRVLDNTWTYDVFLSEIKSVSVDVNGDGKIDENDKVGYSGDMTEALCNIPFGCGISLTSSTDEGIVLNFWGDKILEIFNNTYDVLMDASCSQGYFRSVETKQLFSDNLSLFTIATTSAMDNLRDEPIEFGVLPMPKYDSNQKEYACYAWPCFVCVPTTILRYDLVGAGLEQFAYESTAVKIAYIEDLIRGKSTRDEESLQMLDVIYDSQVCDIGASYLGFDPQFHKVFYCFFELMKAKNQNITSHYEKSEKAILKVLDKLSAKIIENQSN